MSVLLPMHTSKKVYVAMCVCLYILVHSYIYICIHTYKVMEKVIIISAPLHAFQFFFSSSQKYSEFKPMEAKAYPSPMPYHKYGAACLFKIFCVHLKQNTTVPFPKHIKSEKMWKKKKKI